MSLKDLAIIGAGGFGHEVRRVAEYNGYKVLGFFDDHVEIPDVIGHTSEISTEGYLLSIAVGDSSIRQRIHRNLNPNFDTSRFPNLIDSRVLMFEDVQMGIGNIISPGCTLTTNISIKDFCVINLNCTIGHNTHMESFVSLMPGCHVSGDVSIGKGAYIGSGAVILQGLEIGENVRVGAGAVVTKNIPPNTTVKGIPAK